VFTKWQQRAEAGEWTRVKTPILFGVTVVAVFFFATQREALNQTLGRTLISNGTTFLAVLGLFLFGGESLRGFAFCMVVGVVAGTYSTIYIASPIVVWWRTAHPRGRGPGHKAGHAEETSNAP